MIEINLYCVKPLRFGVECVTPLVQIQQIARNNIPAVVQIQLLIPSILPIHFLHCSLVLHHTCSATSLPGPPFNCSYLLCPHLRAFAHNVYFVWIVLPYHSLLNSLFRSQIKSLFENKFSGSKPLYFMLPGNHISLPHST